MKESTGARVASLRPPLAALWLVPGAAAFIVIVCQFFLPDFFFTDDSRSIQLAQFREMGRMWLSGELPLLTSRSLLGGNILVDMAVSPFAPQTILTSILAAITHSNLIPAGFIGWMNIAIVIFSGWWLGRIYALRDEWPLVLGVTLATQPMVLQVFDGAWWNMASAYSWLLFSMAAVLELRLRPSRSAFLLTAVGGSFLFASAGTHLQLMYGLLCIAVVIADVLEHRSIRRIVVLGLAMLAPLLLAALPLMAEYLVVSPMLARANGVHNVANFLVPHWGLVLNAFNPFYGSYMSWFGGYRYVPLSLGYASVLGLFALCLFRWKMPRNTEQSLLIVVGVLATVLSFSPSHLGPLRWPFRLLPVVSTVLSIYFFQRVALGTPRFDAQRIAGCLLIAVVTTVLTVFSADTTLADASVVLRGVFTFTLLGGGCLWAVWLHRRSGATADWMPWAKVLTLAAWMGGLVITPTIAFSHLSMPAVAEPDGRFGQVPGYVLSLCDRKREDDAQTIADLAAGRLLLAGIPSINGYSSVGHRGFTRIFPHATAHGLFFPSRTLANLSAPVEGFPGVFVHNLFRISEVYACKEHLTPQLLATLSAAGLVPAGTLPLDRVVLRPRVPVPDNGNLSVQSGAGEVKHIAGDAMKTEAWVVAPSSEKRTLVFSRIYWPGYRATLDDVPLPVAPILDTLTRLEVPAGRSGILTLTYEPTTWPYTRWGMVLGLLAVAAGLLLLRRQAPWRER